MPEKTDNGAPVRTLYIGVNVFGHDTALFCVDPVGRKIFGMSTERLSRYKHDVLPPLPILERLPDFLGGAADYDRIQVATCFSLQNAAHIEWHEYEKERWRRQALGARFIGEFSGKAAAYNAMTPQERGALLSSTKAGRRLLDLTGDLSPARKTYRQYVIEKITRIFPEAEIVFSSYDHELCHAAASWPHAGFERALALTFDGMGDNQVFSRAYLVEQGRFDEIAFCRSEVETFFAGAVGGRGHVMASVGGIYSWFTLLLGFERNADEGKVEALAAFGKPIPALYQLLTDATRLDPDACTLTLDVKRLQHALHVDAMTTVIAEHGKENVAATAQAYLEDSVLKYVEALAARTGERRLALSGGVFANVVLNLKLFEQISKEIHIAPAMADDGAAQGACYLAMQADNVDHDAFIWLREQRMPYFGSAYKREQALAALQESADQLIWEDLGEAWPEAVAELLAAHQVGAIFHGRMEWGPRALGNRSIIADPRPDSVRERLNRDIKRRPSFQPFCPSILIEEKDRLFDDAYDNLHMTCAFRMKAEHAQALPGAAHIDGTARVQFVHETDNPNYHRLIRRFQEISGYGVILNTSFNKHGRTIVESPADAVLDFLDTDLPFLCIEGYLVRRKDVHLT